MPRTALDIPDVPHPLDLGPRSPRRRRGLWAYWSKRPVATVLWALVMAWCIHTLPSVTSAWPAGAPRLPSGADGVPRATLVKRAGAIVAVDLNDERPTDRVIGAAWYDYRLRPEFEMQGVSIVGSGIPLSDYPACRAAYLAHLSSHPNPYWRRTAARLQSGDSISTLMLHGRRLVQLSLSIFVLPLLLFRSLAWAEPILVAAAALFDKVPPADPMERERLRRRRKLAAGLCPGCGYSIVGLPRRRCPECNETWTSEELPT